MKPQKNNSEIGDIIVPVTMHSMNAYSSKRRGDNWGQETVKLKLDKISRELRTTQTNRILPTLNVSHDQIAATEKKYLIAVYWGETDWSK